jgi:hypothetical protein
MVKEYKIGKKPFLGATLRPTFPNFVADRQNFLYKN